MLKKIISPQKAAKIDEIDKQTHHKTDAFQQKLRRMIKAGVLPDDAKRAMTESKAVHAYSKSGNVTDARAKLQKINAIERRFESLYKRKQAEKAKTMRKLKRQLKHDARQPIKDLERHIKKGIDAQYQQKTLDKIQAQITKGENAKDEKDLNEAIKETNRIIKDNNITDAELNEIQQKKYPVIFNVMDKKDIVLTDKQIKDFFSEYGKLKAIATNDPNLSNYKSLSKAVSQSIGPVQKVNGPRDYDELMNAVRKAYDAERRDLEFSPDEDENWDDLIWSLGNK